MNCHKYKSCRIIYTLKKKISLLIVDLKEKHKSSLFNFLYYDIPYHNNHTEREIKPCVILRKITFGNRSKTGILNQSIISSIIQTAKLNGFDPLKILKELLVGKDKEKDSLLFKIRSP